MKKSLLALAVLGAFAGAAQAQSAVTIYGSFDGGLRYRTNVNAAGDSVWTMGSTGTYNSNRLGFKGVEDLGGGMNAHFTLESGFNTGTGALNNANNQLFERTASVGLGGKAGNSTWALDLGRQYTNAFLTVITYDPFTFRYPGIALGVPATAGTRYNNDVKYTGNFGPITARVEWALGEVPGNNNAGSAKSVSLGYKDGPVAAGAAYTVLRSATDLQTKHWTLGGAYSLGFGRLTAGYADQKAEQTTGIDTRNKWMWVGFNYNATPALEITPAWYRAKQDGGVAGALEGKKDLFMISAAYALSKRTNFYGLIDHARLDNALRVGTQDRQNEVAVGINHLF
ncbi:porin [Oxalobacteraceae bacterium OM1]|nr:porin [Oxalobacteraceae bacterium OM1]